MDHIASEIEDLMTADNYDFEQAFKLIFEKWKPELTPSYSWLMGIGFSAPKVVMDKMVSYSTKTMKWLLGLLVIFFLIYLFTDQTGFNEGAANLWRISFKTILCICYVTTIVGRLTLRNSKFKTTYSVTFKRKFVFVTLYFLAFMLDVYPIIPLQKSEEIQLLSLFFVLIFTLYMVSGIVFLARHYKTKKVLHLN